MKKCITHHYACECREEGFKALEKENAILKEIIINTMWMSRRYAHNRSTFAPTIVNEAIDFLEKIGITIEDDIDIGKYCDDGMFGKWNKERSCFEKEAE